MLALAAAMISLSCLFHADGAGAVSVKAIEDLSHNFTPGQGFSTKGRVLFDSCHPMVCPKCHTHTHTHLRARCRSCHRTLAVAAKKSLGDHRTDDFTDDARYARQREKQRHTAAKRASAQSRIVDLLVAIGIQHRKDLFCLRVEL